MQISTDIKRFPFHSQLSLRLLIDFWEKTLLPGQVSLLSDRVRELLDSAKALKEPIKDIAILKDHQGLINLLMTAVVSPASADRELVAAILPFQNRPIFSTKYFDSAFPDETMDDLVTVNIPGNRLIDGRILHACLLILKKFYHADLKIDKPILLTVRNSEDQLEKVYKAEINDSFCEIICRSDSPRPIDPKIIRFLSEKIYDVDLWLQYIKPEDFEFQGFMVMRLTDVTQEEMLSSIKYDLLKKDAVVNNKSFNSIQGKLRSIFGIPELRLGLAYMGLNNQIILNGETDCWNSLLTSDNCTCDFNGSIYERSWSEQRNVTIEDLRDYPFKTAVEEMLLRNNVKNILLAPLLDDGETIGIIELATSTPGLLNAISSGKVENILPMFTVAVKRAKAEMETEVRAIIQEECTAIHSTVQWRFFDAGVNLLNKRRMNEPATLEEIVFNDVYPFFGMVDIRNSSTMRNIAIQRDLEQNLKLIRELLVQISNVKPFPVIEESIFKTNKHLTTLYQGLASGDESNVLDFIKNEVNPLLQNFEGDSGVSHFIAKYKQALDPRYGIVYDRRKSFEDSLATINNTLSAVIDSAEEKAQAMFPHYFEKYKTDGLEYTLYLGSSLVKDKKFDPFYLKNFRLWQLLLSAEIEHRMKALKPSLHTPLDITQLILAVDEPISIRFRPDEKQFDVDGAYDIRYEIVKKRIDKAHIKNTDERLTQPGKIAIVYSQSRIAEEYKRYFQYLADKKLIHSSIEELELEELPGASGLRALRVDVVTESASENEYNNLLQNIEEAVHA